MSAPGSYLFDGHNLLHAGGFAEPRELVDMLASWLSLKGARGTVVFDGKEIWGPDTDPTLTVSIDAFEPYLEPA